MYLQDKLVEFIDNELPEDEKQSVFAELAVNEALREDLRIMMLIKNGIGNNMDEFAEPPELAGNIFAGLGYAIPTESDSREPDRLPFTHSAIVACLIAASLLFSVLALIFLIPAPHSGSALMAGRPVNETGNSISKSLMQMAGNVPDGTQAPTGISCGVKVEEPANYGLRKEIAFQKQDDPPVIAQMPAGKEQLPVMSSASPALSNDEPATDSSDGLACTITDSTSAIVLADGGVELADSRDSVWVMDDKGGSYVKKWALETDLSYSFDLSARETAEQNSKFIINPGFRFYYNLNSSFSVGAGFYSNLYTIDNKQLRVSSYGIGLKYTWDNLGNIRPVGKLMLAFNEKGPLLKFDAGIEFLTSANKSWFVTVGYENLFLKNTVNCPKLGITIGYSIAF